MKKKWLIIIVVLIFVITIILINKKTHFHNFQLNHASKYLVTTDFWMMTMQNDGGSHANEYYEIDLSQNTIEKRSDFYNRSLGQSTLRRFLTSYKGKLLYKANINEENHQKMQALFSHILENADREIDLHEYRYYTLSSQHTSNVKMTEDEKQEFMDMVAE